MAKVMQACGVVCGHENVYDHSSICWKRWTKEFPEWEADSSWLAVPHLHEFDGNIIHLVRHPLKVIRSLCSIKVLTDGYLNSNPYSQYKHKHCPKAWAHKEPHNRAAHFWIEWNKRINPYADARIKIEDIEPKWIQSMLWLTGRDKDIKEIEAAMGVSTSYNAMPKEFEDLELSDLDDDLLADLIELANTYGYDLDYTIKNYKKHKNRMHKASVSK